MMPMVGLTFPTAAELPRSRQGSQIVMACRRLHKALPASGTPEALCMDLLR